jgi:hypothetical protein
MADDDGDYPIGYGKPPEHARFKKGQSGNPNGRPRGSKNLDTILERELNRTIVIKENGQSKIVSKRVALAKQQVNKAISGDYRAAKLVFERTGRTEPPPSAVQYEVGADGRPKITLAVIRELIRLTERDDESGDP